MPFDDLQSTRRYRAMRVYGQSKLANILFTLELVAAALGQGRDGQLAPSRARCARGTAPTETPAASSPSASRSPAPFFLSPAKGARTSVYLASSPDVEGVSGEYFVKCKPRQPRRWAQDADAAARLWR